MYNYVIIAYIYIRYLYFWSKEVLSPSPLTAKLLGYLGVLPFAALATLHVYGAPKVENAALEGFLAYGAVILSFLGGIRWGVASLDDRFRGLAPVISAVPSLWAFVFLVWPDPETSVWGLMAGFILLGAADRWFTAPGGADWMIALRSQLSVAVIACHVILVSSLTLR
jgi:hypothetical protein